MKKYEYIASHIRERIINKEFLIGDKLPYEYELMEEYHVSKQTLNKSLEILSSEGLIIRRRGAGTFVKSTDMINQDTSVIYGQMMKGFTKHFEDKGKVTNEVLFFEVIPSTLKIANKLEISEGTFVYHMGRVRIINDEKHVIEKMYMPVDLLPGVTHNILEGSLYSYFQDVLGKKIKDAHLIIKAEPSTAEDQKLLGLSKNEPIVEVEKVAFLTNGSPFEYSFSRFHYQHFSYSAVMEIK